MLNQTGGVEMVTPDSKDITTRSGDIRPGVGVVPRRLTDVYIALVPVENAAMEPKIWFLAVGLAALAGGVLSLGGSVLNLDVFFNSPKAQPIVQSLGRMGARLFYLVLGLVFILVGVFLTFRGIQLFQQGP